MRTLLQAPPTPSDTCNVEEREELATSEGFDWLYSEDASGSVVGEPPAIGAVTEVGESVAPPTGLGGRVSSAVDVEDLMPVEFDPAELDASFGPVTPQPAAEPFSTVQEPVQPETTEDLEDLDPFGTSQVDTAPVMTPPAREMPVAPPPPPPPVSAPVAEAQAPVVPEFQANPVVPDSDAMPVEAERTVAEVYGFNQATSMSPAGEEATTRMPAVAEPTGQIPVFSSRGDIIAEGPRKLSLRERLTPEIKTRGATAEAPRREGLARGTRPMIAVLVMTLSLAGTLWRMEGLREKIFGGGAPSSQQLAGAFGTLRGYAYQPLSDGQQQMIDSIETMMSEQTAQFGLDLDMQMDMRLLMQGGRQAGAVVIMSVDPDDMNHPDFEAGFRAGLSRGAGTMQPMTLKGHTVYSGKAPQAMGATVIVFFDPDGFVFTVAANNEAASKDVAGQLAKANL
jgi:hypothetical protein